MEEQNPKELGNLQTLKLDLDTPIKINSEVTLNQLNIMVGENASGKSLMLKTVYACGTIMGMSHMYDNKPELKSRPLSEITQYVFDNTFQDQNFHGAVTATYINGSLNAHFEKGKVTAVIRDIKKTVNVVPATVFMSSNMRTFAAMDSYLALWESLSEKEDILKYYRLYDVGYVEMIKRKLPFSIDEELSEVLKSFEPNGKMKDISSIFIRNGGFMYSTRSGEEARLATLSNGEQAMINIMVGAR